MANAIDLLRAERVVEQNGRLTTRFYEFLRTLVQDVDGAETVASVGNLSNSATDYLVQRLLFQPPLVVTSAYTTTESGIIVTDGYDITLNDKPKAHERVYIKTKQSITINGNGKTIDGETSISSGVDYTCLLLVYVIESDEWLII